jgi:hypothetical protein
MSKTLLAFRTEAIGTTCIVFAERAGQARAATVRAAVDAGYRVTFADVRCRRAKDYDGQTAADGRPIKTNHCYGLDAFKSEANSIQRCNHERAV